MSATMRGFRRLAAAGICVGAVLVAPSGRAGLFDDDEARRAILDIRQRIEQNTERQRTGQQQLTEQIDQLKRSLLDLNNQLEQLRSDNASLRGQNEELKRVVSEIQRKQKDLQAGVDDRMRKMEPQKVSVDGKEFLADPEEKRQYDEAMDLLRKSDFAGTANALSAFRKRYPTSGYNESALFWLGNSVYGSRKYKEAFT
jgi:TolA-binding protein